MPTTAFAPIGSDIASCQIAGPRRGAVGTLLTSSVFGATGTRARPQPSAPRRDSRPRA